MESQKQLREEIEKAEAKKLEDKLEKINSMTKINPNIIWEARKRSKGCSSIDYNTITEEGKNLTDPEETKQCIAGYFENLYQAREGTEEYRDWTEKIKESVKKALTKKGNQQATDHQEKITDKEMKTAITKLKRHKSLGPDKIPNEIFIEANTETRQILKQLLEKAHKEETIPKAWEEGEIIRLYKGKGQKGKCSNERGIILASNVGKVYERIINERVKQQVQITKAQAGGKKRMCNSGPPNCPQTDHTRNK